MTDVSALVVRWQAGDERAAEALYNYHRDRTFRLAYGILGNQQDAEDVAQVALTYALTNIDRYDPDRASFSTWLHVITVSRCRDHQRRRRFKLFSLSSWLYRGNSVADPEPAQEQRVIRHEVQDEIWTAVQNLSPCQREAIILRYWAGHTYREIGEIMNCPLPTAQSRVRLAYEHLREVLPPDILDDISDLEKRSA